MENNVGAAGGMTACRAARALRSGSGDNPNYAYRVMTPGGPCQDVVQVWLTDGCSTDDASRTIYDYCDSSCKILP